MESLAKINEVHNVCCSVRAVKDLFAETPYGEGKGEKTSFKLLSDVTHP